MPMSLDATMATLDVLGEVGSMRTRGQDLGQVPHLSSQGIGYPHLSTICAAEQA